MTRTCPRVACTLVALAAVAGMASSSAGCDSAASDPGDPSATATDNPTSDTELDTPAPGGELLLEAPVDVVGVGLAFVIGFEVTGTTDDIADISFAPEGVVELDPSSAWSGIGVVAVSEGETTLTVTNSDGISASALIRVAHIADLTVLTTTDAFGVGAALVTDIAPDGLSLAAGASVAYGCRAHDAQGREMLVDYAGLWAVTAGADLVEVSHPQENWIALEALGGDGLVELSCGDTALSIATTSAPAAAEIRLFDLFEATSILLDPLPESFDPVATVAVPRGKPEVIGAARYDAEGRLLLAPATTWAWSLEDTSVAETLAGALGDVTDVTIIHGLLEASTQLTVSCDDLSVTVALEVYEPSAADR